MPEISHEEIQPLSSFFFNFNYITRSKI